MKDILQAIIDGKQLLAAGGVPIEHKTALNYLSRGLTVTIKPEKETAMVNLTTHQRELLQAVLDGKELVGVVSGTPHDSQDLLHAIARQPTSLKVKPDTVHRFIPVLKMPAGSIYMAEGKIVLERAKDPAHNGKAPFDNALAGVLHVEIEPATMTLVKVEMVKP